jgi:hypothetical protein
VVGREVFVDEQAVVHGGSVCLSVRRVNGDDEGRIE